MNTQLRLTFIFLSVFMAGLPLLAQTDCMEKEEELGEPLMADSTRVINPETYDETIYTVEIYRVGELRHMIKADTTYSYDHKTQGVILEISNTYVIDFTDADKVVEKNNKKIYYTEKDGCLRIFKITRIYEREYKAKD